MVANTFHIAIPGWEDSTEGSSDTESIDYIQEEPLPSASSAESAAEEEEMVEIDISSFEQEGDAFWSLLTGLGIESSGQIPIMTGFHQSKNAFFGHSRSFANPKPNIILDRRDEIYNPVPFVF